jgi:hypothetical protein
LPSAWRRISHMHWIADSMATCFSHALVFWQHGGIHLHDMSSLVQQPDNTLHPCEHSIRYVLDTYSLTHHL